MSGAPSAQDFRYEPRLCPFLSRQVWAIQMQQSDGSWKIVNCLDKDEPCFGVDCAFTTSGGRWPFSVHAGPSARSAAG